MAVSSKQQVDPQIRDAMSLDDLFTIGQLVKSYPAILTEPTLRWQLRHREANGLASACVRVGKKLLIHKPSYEKWLPTRGGAS